MTLRPGPRNRHLPDRADPETGMPVLPRRRTLQAGQLPRSEALQLSVLLAGPLEPLFLLPTDTRTDPVSGPSTAMLLEKEPNNMQAQSLKQLIEAAVSKGPSHLCFHGAREWRLTRLLSRLQRATSAWRSRQVRPQQPVSSLLPSWAPAVGGKGSSRGAYPTQRPACILFPGLVLSLLFLPFLACLSVI